MLVKKHIIFIKSPIYIFLIFLNINQSCNSYPSEDNLKKFAIEKFCNAEQYMDETEAITKKIDFYKPPSFLISKHCVSLTGEQTLHLCNLIMIYDEEKKVVEKDFGEMSFEYYIFLDDIKVYSTAV